MDGLGSRHISTAVMQLFMMVITTRRLNIQARVVRYMWAGAVALRHRDVSAAEILAEAL
jgi:hypothetical protein